MFKRKPSSTTILNQKTKKRIGELLVNAGLIKQEELDEALEIQQKSGGKLVQILIDLDYLNPQIFVKFLSKQQGIAGIDLLNYMIPKHVINLIPEEFARKHELIPIDKMGNYLTIAMACPLDTKSLEEMERTTGLKVKPLLVSISDVHAAIRRYYGPKETPTFNDMPYAPNAAGSQSQRSRTQSQPPAEPVKPLDENALPGSAHPTTVDVASASEQAAMPSLEAVTEGSEKDIAAQIESALTFDRILGLIHRVESLPALSETVLALKKAIENPEVTARELAAILVRDPALSAKVLSLANSAAYSFSHTIGNIELATALLGNKEIYNIAMSASVIDYFQANEAFDYGLFWKRSAFCASAAKRLAQNRNLKDTGAAFAAGLLHDLGKIVLAEIVPQAYASINPFTVDASIVAKELEAYGIAHPEVGFILADAWGLPTAISAPIRFHQNPSLAQEEKEMVNIVALASRMTDAYTVTCEEGTQDLMAQLEISESAFFHLLDHSAQELAMENRPHPK